MLVKLTEEQIERDARVAFFEVIERISPIQLSEKFNQTCLNNGIDIDFDSITGFEKEIERLKLQFAMGEVI